MQAGTRGIALGGDPTRSFPELAINTLSHRVLQQTRPTPSCSCRPADTVYHLMYGRYGDAFIRMRMHIDAPKLVPLAPASVKSMLLQTCINYSHNTPRARLKPH